MQMVFRKAIGREHKVAHLLAGIVPVWERVEYDVNKTGG
jgi:hypothetical protein